MNSGHLASLAAKHAQIEFALSVENLRPHPDTLRITALKRVKLRLKQALS